MISPSSLAAFSATFGVSGLAAALPSARAGVFEFQQVREVAPSPARPGAGLPAAPTISPGQKLPRGSLLDLSV